MNSFAVFIRRCLLRRTLRTARPARLDLVLIRDIIEPGLHITLSDEACATKKANLCFDMILIFQGLGLLAREFIAFPSRKCVKTTLKRSVLWRWIQLPSSWFLRFRLRFLVVSEWVDVTCRGTWNVCRCAFWV